MGFALCQCTPHAFPSTRGRAFLGAHGLELLDWLLSDFFFQDFFGDNLSINRLDLLGNRLCANLSGLSHGFLVAVLGIIIRGLGFERNVFLYRDLFFFDAHHSHHRIPLGGESQVRFIQATQRNLGMRHQIIDGIAGLGFYLQVLRVGQQLNLLSRCEQR